MTPRQHLESGFWRRRPLFWMVLAYCAGIWLDAEFAFSPLYTMLGAAAAIAAGIVAAIRTSAMQAGSPHHNSQAGTLLQRHGAFAAALMIALLLGAGVHAARFRIPPRDDISRLTPPHSSFARVRGTIIEAEWRTADVPIAPGIPPKTHWIVDVEALGSGADAWVPASGRIRVAVRAETPPPDSDSDEAAEVPSASNDHSEKLAEGDRVEFRALLAPPSELTLPDSFDYGAYLSGQGVRRMGFVTSGTSRRVAGPAWWRVDLKLRRWSGVMASQTPELLHGHVEQAGLLNALIFGRRESLSVSDREAFAISGTAHILAISGLHIQLVCAFLGRVLAYFGLSRRRTAVWVLAVCAAYCVMTGSSPPVVRAMIMFGTYAAAFFFQRDADPLNALAAAALVVLSYAPHDLFNAGFQLSFLAVFALFILVPAFEFAWGSWRMNQAGITAADVLEPRNEWYETWVLKPLWVSLAAWLATAPAVAWHMGRFATLSLFVNLLAVPLLSVCMAAGFVTLVLGAIWMPLGLATGWFAVAALSVMEWINAVCAALPGASVDLPRPPAILLVFYAGLMLWLWIVRDEKSGSVWTRWIVPGSLVMLLSTALFRSGPATPELTVLDLSRGRAALLEAPGGAALIDSGGAGQGQRIAEVLRRRGIQSLALLVLTSDEPGALDGAVELTARIRPARVILPRCKFPSDARRALESRLAANGIPYGPPSASEKLITPGNVRWEFQDDGPPPDQPAANSSCLCVRVSFGGIRMLFVETKSAPALTRLLSKSDTGFEANVLRISPGPRGGWPRETNELIRRARCSTIVAGTFADADELPGVDFAALNAKVLSPFSDGSVRIREHGGKIEFHTFRGEWRKVE